MYLSRDGVTFNRQIVYHVQHPVCIFGVPCYPAGSSEACSITQAQVLADLFPYLLRHVGALPSRRAAHIL